MNKVKDKYLSEEVEEFSIDENKFNKNNSLRQDSEFFNDEDYIVHDLISVKRAESKKEENWEILRNKKPVLLLKGSRFTLKERTFLRSVSGVQYIINGYKSGWKTIADFKKNLSGLI